MRRDERGTPLLSKQSKADDARKRPGNCEPPPGPSPPLIATIAMTCIATEGRKAPRRGRRDGPAVFPGRPRAHCRTCAKRARGRGLSGSSAPRGPCPSSTGRRTAEISGFDARGNPSSCLPSFTQPLPLADPNPGLREECQRRRERATATQRAGHSAQGTTSPSYRPKAEASPGHQRCLQEEIERQQRMGARDSAPMEYLKNIGPDPRLTAQLEVTPSLTRNCRRSDCIHGNGKS